jgi:hypothetical protein
MKKQTPNRAENNDWGHMERPTGEEVHGDLGLFHAVKEKLQAPG